MRLKSFIMNGMKHHPDGVTKAADDHANAMGDAASGRPWQEDRGGSDTDSLLAVPDPRLEVKGDDPASPLRPVGAVVLPAEGASGPLTLLTTRELRELASRVDVRIPRGAHKSEMVNLIIGR